MKNDVYKNYLRDLGFLVKEQALETKKKRASEVGTSSEGFYDGYIQGFIFIISLMQQQAGGFQIPLKDLCLDDIDPYKDLF